MYYQGGSRRGRVLGFGRHRSLVFEDGGSSDVGYAGGYGLPFFAGSEVGIEFYLTVVEWFEFFQVEVTLTCCGKPYWVADVAAGG